MLGIECRPASGGPAVRKEAVMRVRVALSVLAAAGILGGGAQVAAGASVSLCVPSGAAGQTVTSGACSSGGTTVALPSSSADQQTLISVLPYIKFTAAGVGGKPTIKITGANMQLLSGSGSTSGAVNGKGNLVIGYDESP